MILTRDEIVVERGKLRASGRKLVFTNGCFDILHRGHVEYLARARTFGDALVVGLNNDASVKRLKGAERPIVTEEDRAIILDALKSVDYVVLFAEDTPYELIAALRPDVLVKGSDWSVESIVGRDVIESYGGTVHTVAMIPGRSSTNIIESITSKLK